METQEYLVGLMDGTRFKTNNVNLKTVKTLVENSKIFVTKLGNKTVQKQMIAFVAKKEAIEKEGNNIVLSAAGEMFYFKNEDVDKKLESVTNEINQKKWLLVNESVLFNRDCFQYLEELIEDEEIE